MHSNKIHPVKSILNLMYRVVECLNACNLEDVSFVCEDELLLFWVLVSGTEWN